MAAAGSKAVLAGSEAGPAESVRVAWDALRQRIHTVVQECNCIAGEAIWGVIDEGPEAGRLRVHNENDSSCFVELTVDLPGALLRCEFGWSQEGDPWTFQFLEDGCIRRSTAVYNIDGAVNAILDGLVRC